jgi:hypothetical protein
VEEPEDAVEKAKHQKDSIRAQRIIADSIKDHLIPYVLSMKTLKEMFDALSKLFEGKNINRKMNLRTRLKNTKMQKGEMIQEYFSRISEIKEQLKAIGDTIDEDEFVIIALNGLARPWDAFIQSVCGGRKKPYFKRESHREPQPSNKFNNQESHSRNFQKKGQGQDLSSIQCYHCEKMGHKANNCPVIREKYKRKHKRQHAHIVEDEEPPMKMIKDHVLISALLGSVSPREDTWLIDSGASKHTTGKKNTLSCISKKKFSQKVTLGDYYQYLIKGIGDSKYKLDSENSITMKDVLYVLGLKKNLLSISALDKKGYRVAFIDGEVLMWAKREKLNEAIVTGSEENGLYKLKGHPETAMTHAIENSCKLWHRRLAHTTTRRYLTYAKLSQVYQNSRLIRKAYAMDMRKGRTSRTLFQKGTTKQKEYWNSFIQTCVAQCHHPPLAGMYTMYHLLMIILVRPRYIS